MASPIDYRGSPQILKKKKKTLENQKSNPRHDHVTGREIRNQTPIQLVHEQKQNKLQYRGVLVFI